MRPENTSYTLATTSKDYRDCHRLAQQEGDDLDASSFKFPTVMAHRDGKLIGFLGTLPSNHYVIAGPLVVEGGKRPITAMRLVEAYDSVMALHGIKLYYFTVTAGRKDTFSKERLVDFGMKFWEEKDGLLWFKREL